MVGAMSMYFFVKTTRKTGKKMSASMPPKLRLGRCAAAARWSKSATGRGGVGGAVVGSEGTAAGTGNPSDTAFVDTEDAACTSLVEALTEASSALDGLASSGRVGISPECGAALMSDDAEDAALPATAVSVPATEVFVSAIPSAGETADAEGETVVGTAGAGERGTGAVLPGLSAGGGVASRTAGCSLAERPSVRSSDSTKEAC